MKELAMALIAWIGAQHPGLYQEEWGTPEIRVVPKLHLLQIVTEGQVPENVDIETFDLAGVYDYRTETVYVDQKFDMASVEGRGALVHELVHWMQFKGEMDREVSCNRELETLAYELHGAWLEAHGEKPTWDAFTLMMRSLCEFY